MVEGLLRDPILFSPPQSVTRPNIVREEYLLKSLWVLTSAEFEGSIEELIEKHLEAIMEKPIKQINNSILLRSFFQDQQKIEYKELVTLYRRGKRALREAMKNKPFTNNFDVPHPKSIERLFLQLGIHFESEQQARLAFLHSFCERRNLIAHGQQVSITTSELLENIDKMKDAFSLLKHKLSRNR